MPPWWRRKRGRKGRAHALRPLRQPFPPDRRRGRAAARDRAGCGQRERAALPAAAAGRARRGRRGGVAPTPAWPRPPPPTPPRRDRKPENYLAFLHLGMIVILLRSI